jgi:Uma2 family endonuclease
VATKKRKTGQSPKKPTAKVQPTKPKKSEVADGKLKARRRSGAVTAEGREKTPPKKSSKGNAKGTSSGRGKLTGEVDTSSKVTARKRILVSRSKPQTKASGRKVSKSGQKTKPGVDANGHAIERDPVPAKSEPTVPGPRPGHSTSIATPKPARSDVAERAYGNLRIALEVYTRLYGRGHVTGEAHFDWGEAEAENLSPDLAFVSYERWAPYRHVPKNHWHVVPDLVVEIIRNSEQSAQLNNWLDAYFRSGVRRVWVVYPEQSKVHDHESLSSAHVLQGQDVIDGGDMLPGFRLAVRELTGQVNEAPSA